MCHQDSMKWIRYKDVYVHKITVIQVYYSIYVCYHLVFVTNVLLLDKLPNLPLYLNLSTMRCISAIYLFMYLTVGV